MKMTRAGRENFLKQGHEQERELWGAEVKVGNKEYAASVSQRDVETQLEDGGFVRDVDLLVKIRKCLLPVKPENGTRVHYAGEDYRVYRVIGDHEPVWSLRCNTDSE